MINTLERSHSGLVHRSRKPEWGKLHRGFKSHPLRQINFGLWISDCGFACKQSRVILSGLVRSTCRRRQSEIRNHKSEIPGEVQEWLNWQHWKCCERETVP